jgi:predicted DNA-binding mobile mystery protein A
MLYLDTHFISTSYTLMKPALRQIILRGLDDQTTGIRQAKTVPERPTRGWLRATREGLGLSHEDVARKLGTSKQAYAQLEESEQRGAISLKSLERAAEAMGCQFAYFLVPQRNFGPSFAELGQFFDPDARHLAATEHSMALEGQAVGDLPKRKK